MKLLQLLTIGGVEYELAEDRVMLELSGIGRAQFTINTNGEPIAKKSKVEYSAGYSQHDTLQQVFLGYVESVSPVDSKHVQIFCRELLGVMVYPIMLSLRHPDFETVLAEVSEQTGLEFSLPDQPYASKKIPNFVNQGSGLHLLDGAGKAFEVDDFIYQQQGGSIYVGSWADSRWSDLSVDIPDHHCTDWLRGKSHAMAISPALRPGVELNGRRIKKCEYMGYTMTVEY